MSARQFSRRAGAALLCLALLLGPIGPGGAWHVGMLDALTTGFAAAALVDPASRAQHANHAGPSCLTCQSLQWARVVLPTAVVIHLAASRTAPPPPAAPCPPGRGDSRHTPSRAPPLA